MVSIALADARPVPRREPEGERGGHRQGRDAVCLRVLGRASASQAQGILPDLRHGQVRVLRDGGTDVAHDQAAAGADGGGVGRPVAARPVGAVAGCVQVDQIGIDPPQGGAVHALPLRRGAPERLQRQVRPLRELVHDGSALVGGHVDRDALLALHHLGRAELGERQQGPHRLALDRLDLDHPGPELAQHRAAERRREERAELEHDHVPQRRAGRRATSALARAAGVRYGAPWVGAQRRTVRVERRRAAAEHGGGLLEARYRPRLAHRAALGVE